MTDCTRHTPLLLAAGLGLWAVACGSASGAVVAERAPTEAPRTSAPSIEPAASTPESACAFDLDAVAASGITVTYRIDGEPEASLRWTPEPSAGNGDEAWFTYVLRDENGLEQGAERYACDPTGLRLIAAGPAGSPLSFAPPLLTVPVGASDGIQAGTASLADGSDAGLGFAYRYAFETEPVTPSGPLSEHGERWMRVRSVLVLERDGVLHEWANETVWALGDTELVPMRRVQEMRSGNAVETRVEEARTITREARP